MEHLHFVRARPANSPKLQVPVYKKQYVPFTVYMHILKDLVFRYVLSNRISLSWVYNGHALHPENEFSIL